MSKHNVRVWNLEKKIQPSAAPQMSDEERFQRMKELAVLIAREARVQGVTASEDPRLALPLEIAQVIE
jgi:hypothetical protein